MECREGRGGRERGRGLDLRQDAVFPQDKQRAAKAWTETYIIMQMFQQTCVKEDKPSLFTLNKLRKPKPDL